MGRDPDKRGRLHSIDLLPDEAWPHVQDAIAALKARKKPAETIREEFNTHLLAMGLDPISKSAFNRYSLMIAAMGGAMLRAREAANLFVDKVAKVEDDNVGLLLTEMGKSIIFDMMSRAAVNDGEFTPKELAAIALTLQRFEKAAAVNIAAARLRVEDYRASAAAAVDTAAKAAGLSAETAEAIKSKILGILPPAPGGQQKGGADGQPADT